jgi:hypothetical protein
VDPQVSPPQVCEACGSPAVTARAKVVRADTYFNCDACGHIWNPSRSHPRDRGWR